MLTLQENYLLSISQFTMNHFDLETESGREEYEKTLIENFEKKFGIVLDRDNFRPFSSKCKRCKYFVDTHRLCAAYPYGIPDVFLLGEEHHFQVMNEQQGDIIYTPKK